MSCPNCGASSLESLSKVNSRDGLVPNSDGQFIENLEAERLLCSTCACISIQFYPPDRLLKYFKEEYDISDEVQNNLIVFNNKVHEKHKEIAQNLNSYLKNTPANSKVLEIACGRGELISHLAESHPQWNCEGIDPSAQAQFNDRKNLKFINDYFKKDYFSSNSYDLIVAHGILNRMPTLPSLKDISALLKVGGLFSVEVVVLEQSFYAPFIWDHSFTYSQTTFESYLKKLGFEIIACHDCVSTYQYVCRLIEKKDDLKTLDANALTQKTKNIFQEQLQMAKKVQAKANKYLAEKGNQKIGLFGAGLYSAVLLHLIDPKKIDFILDETKAGKTMLGIPVIKPQEISRYENACVLLYCRAQYVGVLSEKVRQNKAHCVNLLES